MNVSTLLEVGWMQMHISNYFKINMKQKSNQKNKKKMKLEDE